MPVLKILPHSEDASNNHNPMQVFALFARYIFYTDRHFLLPYTGVLTEFWPTGSFGIQEVDLSVRRSAIASLKWSEGSGLWSRKLSVVNRCKFRLIGRLASICTILPEWILMILIYDTNQTSTLPPFPLLHGYLSYLENPCFEGDPLIQYIDRSGFASQPYPYPNITLHEIQDPTVSSHSVEWTLFNIFTQGGGNSGINPLETDGSWTFDSILLDMFYQLPCCDLETWVFNRFTSL